MAIQIICTGCGTKLNAPDAMAGKKGRCPNCRTVFRIPLPEQAAVSMAGSAASAEKSEAGKQSSLIHVDSLPSLNPTRGFPKRMGLHNLYVIMGADRTAAFYKLEGGWQLNVGRGFASARQENSMVPEQGGFTLVEGIVRETENGRRLFGIQFFQIGGEGSLTAITRDKDEILNKLTGRTTLTLPQKRHFLSFLRDQYFPSFTEDAPEIIDYLIGEDFHSKQVGDCRCDNTEGLPLEE